MVTQRKSERKYKEHLIVVFQNTIDEKILNTKYNSSIESR